MSKETPNEASRRALLSAAASVPLATLLAAALPAPAHAAAGHLHVIAELDAKPGSEAALRDLMIPFAKGALHEPGCLHYTLMEVQNDPSRLLTYEIWTDRAALDAHMQTPQIKAALPKLGPLLAKPFTQISLNALT